MQRRQRLQSISLGLSTMSTTSWWYENGCPFELRMCTRGRGDRSPRALQRGSGTCRGSVNVAAIRISGGTQQQDEAAGDVRQTRLSREPNSLREPSRRRLLDRIGPKQQRLRGGRSFHQCRCLFPQAAALHEQGTGSWRAEGERKFKYCTVKYVSGTEPGSLLAAVEPSNDCSHKADSCIS